MEIPASYKGREQAFVKHTLLRAYLERLFMIVGQHEFRAALPYQYCAKVLGQAKGTAEQGRKSVGDKLSPVEIDGKTMGQVKEGT
jgi:hypothetical protein